MFRRLAGIVTVALLLLTPAQGAFADNDVRQKDAATAAQPPTVQTSYGCTGASGDPTGQVCLGIYGSSSNITNIRVARTAYFNQITNICYHSSKIVLTYPGGGTATWRTPRSGGCSSFAPVMHNYGSFGYLPSGTRVCGTFYQDGASNGTACNNI